ncbi:MAG: hypothetical protein FJW35_10325 [Acidobacteria bacterium]|nr:hypothetical protein [Acidobacteriota bacterium]
MKLRIAREEHASVILRRGHRKGIGMRNRVARLDVRSRQHIGSRNRHNMQGQLINGGQNTLRNNKPPFAFYYVQHLPQVDQRQI